MRNLITKLLGDQNAKAVKRLEPIVAQINDLEAKFEKVKDLSKETARLKKEIVGGKTLDDVLPEAFALVREAGKRKLKQRHYDVQLIGGMVLHEGKIAEMKTGEGKTLVATLPVYLNALTGKGVHVVSVNDYLVQRDAGWMGEIYNLLGLTTGVIIHEQALLFDPKFNNPDHDDERLKRLKPVSRQEAYQADITYGTNNEFGFDYLRDNMVDDVAKMVQRPLHFAIVDEVDSILIDEARTPLIISSPAEESTDKYYQFAKLSETLNEEKDYTLDEKLKAASLTDEGIAKIEKALGVDNIYEAGRIDEVHHIEQALKAKALFRRDRDYVVRDDEVIIVDEFTGRLMPGRRWSEGLHQAVEAKEGVHIQQESLTLATITFQNYFRLYEKLSGMTGTAETESEEFHKIYGLDVVVIPTNRDMVRQDFPDKIYKTEEGKFRAIAMDVKEMHDKGQPVLIGTVSIEKNELLGSFLKQLKVPHEILNAKNNEKEATIVAGAGQKGAVTLATNIAGRGTDIVLEKGVDKLGGLAVVGSERHEARRIDNQLRGRSGRQGDPGFSRFYVSLEDDLMRIFGGERIAGLMGSLGIDDDTPIENSMVSKSIESAQKKVEGHNFDIRKNLVEYDDVMNRHREVIYAKRRKALENQNLRPEIIEMIDGEFKAIVTAHTDVRTTVMDHDKVVTAVANIVPLDDKLIAQIKKSLPEEVVHILMKHAEALYDWRTEQVGQELMKLAERLTYLRVMDNLWIEHLDAMTGLREGIGLRAVGQKDPLVEYKAEGYKLFQQLIGAMEAEIAATIFKVEITMQQQQAPVETALTKAAEKALTGGGGEEFKKKPATRKQSGVTTTKPLVASASPLDSKKKIGRNDPCPCGSGLKYKKCGLINSPEHQAHSK